MTRMMFGPLVLLAASASPAPPAVSPAAGTVDNSRPAISATARATVSIRIVSGVRFGSGEVSGADGATRRKAVLADADGSLRPAEILEFQ
jgi:hypothetical protein